MPKDAIIGIVFLAILIVIAIIANKKSKAKAEAEKKKIAVMTPEERQKFLKEKKERIDNTSKSALYGALNLPMVCPHCQQTGCVRTKNVKMKKGISGGKATGAVLTGGVSMLATGLSRKEQQTEAYCENCKNKWYF